MEWEWEAEAAGGASSGKPFLSLLRCLSVSARLFCPANGDWVWPPAIPYSGLSLLAEGTWDPLSTKVPSVPCLSSVCPELTLRVWSLLCESRVPQQRHTDTDTEGGGQPVCKYPRGPGLPLPLG